MQLKRTLQSIRQYTTYNQVIQKNYKSHVKGKKTARFLDYLRATTRIRNAHGGRLISVFDKASVFCCNFSFALNCSFKENDENLQFRGLGLVSSQVDIVSGN